MIAVILFLIYVRKRNDETWEIGKCIINEDGCCLHSLSLSLSLCVCVCVGSNLLLMIVHSFSPHLYQDHTELEMGDLLGAGGYGEVYRAMWKGTDVAVKMMTSEVVTKEMQRNFIDEVLKLACSLQIVL